LGISVLKHYVDALTSTSIGSQSHC